MERGKSAFMEQLSGSWIYIELFYSWVAFLLSLQHSAYWMFVSVAEQLMLQKRKWMRKKREQQLFPELL